MTRNPILWSALTTAVCAISVCAGVAAAPQNGCDGLWKGHFIDRARGWDTDADLNIAGDAGEWTAHLGRHKAKHSPCREVKFPVAVLKCTDAEFDFRVDGASIPGCPSFTAKLVRKDADTAEGVKDLGEKDLQMIRQK